MLLLYIYTFSVSSTMCSPISYVGCGTPENTLTFFISYNMLKTKINFREFSMVIVIRPSYLDIMQFSPPFSIWTISYLKTYHFVANRFTKMSDYYLTTNYYAHHPYNLAGYTNPHNTPFSQINFMQHAIRWAFYMKYISYISTPEAVWKYCICHIMAC